MTDYNSDIVAEGSPARGGVYPQFVSGQVDIAANTTLGTGDSIELITLPRGRVYDVWLDIPDLDDDDTPTLVMDLETDEDTPTEFITGITAGQGSGHVRPPGSLGGGTLVRARFGQSQFNGGERLVLKPTTGAAGDVGGSQVSIYFIVWTKND